MSYRLKSVTCLAVAACLSGGVMQTAFAESVTWDVSLWGKKRAFTMGVEKLAELVSDKTNGEFKLNISYGGLSKPRENLDGLSIGAFQMAQFCAFYHTDKNPSITVAELPFLQDISLKRAAEIHDEVYKHPTVKKDLARWNVTLLMPSPMPQYNIISKTDPLRALEDFDGLRTRGPGGIVGVLSQLGAVKTSVPFPEVRQAMDSGVIDAASFAPHAHLATKTYAVGKWVTTNLNLGTANCPVAVGTEALAGLSAAHREALLSSVPEAIDFYVDNYDTKTTAAYQKAIDDAGLTQITFNDNQVARLNVLSDKVRRDWVDKYQKDFDAEGLLMFTQKLYEGK